MRIVSSYRGTERVFETPKSDVLFGRPDDQERIDLDLSPDLKVSRRHGRIWEENGQFWIEDLNSSRGTLLSAVEIKGQGKRERSEEHTSELQSLAYLVCRLLLEKKKEDINVRI